ncbi:unnamed protein product, partial [Amoebophrya sp. A120]
ETRRTTRGNGITRTKFLWVANSTNRIRLFKVLRFITSANKKRALLSSSIVLLLFTKAHQ